MTRLVLPADPVPAFVRGVRDATRGAVEPVVLGATGIREPVDSPP